MKKINVPFIPQSLSSEFNSSDVWFIYQSKNFIKVIKPQKYTDLYNGQAHQEYEKRYREHIKGHPEKVSFVKSSLFNATDTLTPSKILMYQDYTYYFKLSPDQIEKCLFSITINGKNNLEKGVQGFMLSYKHWYEKKDQKETNQFTDCAQNNIEVIIPFKIKPQYYIPEVKKRIFYHGSKERFKSLNKFSYVTPYKEDAIKFAIPWSSEELLTYDSRMLELGRPPKRLLFKENVNIEDSKVYLYSVKGIETINSGTNTDKIFPWNRITLKEASEENKSLKLEKKIMSWKKEINCINI